MEMVIARGHENITSKHKTTIEITKDEEISLRADCVVGVKADKSLVDFSEEFKKKARDRNSIIRAVLRAGGLQEEIVGRGHPNLTFSHKTDIVIRKSNYVCPRTLMINADKSSKELDRRLVKLLKNRDQKIVLEVEVLSS
jgi:hypothetical protein